MQLVFSSVTQVSVICISVAYIGAKTIGRYKKLTCLRSLHLFDGVGTSTDSADGHLGVRETGPDVLMYLRKYHRHICDKDEIALFA